MRLKCSLKSDKEGFNALVVVDIVIMTIDSDPFRASIKAITDASLPLFLPCTSEKISLGTGFDSKLAIENASPWKRSIFSRTATDKSIGILELKEEQHSFRSSFTLSGHQTSDHFSGSLGLTVGNDILSAGVSGKYDKLVAASKEV